MDRIKFSKGKQREFLGMVADRLNVTGPRGILQFGFDVNHSTLKNYFNESRLLPRELFEDLCLVAKIDSAKITFRIVEGNWGQVKGGKISRRKI